MRAVMTGAVECAMQSGGSSDLDTLGVEPLDMKILGGAE
jgi:hypothetical protein